MHLDYVNKQMRTLEVCPQPGFGAFQHSLQSARLDRLYS